MGVWKDVVRGGSLCVAGEYEPAGAIAGKPVWYMLGSIEFWLLVVMIVSPRYLLFCLFVRVGLSLG